ncbi:hypothetical protein OPT61_g5151 [Boeremia exigua]|uniref:Uncharacterized protein n=1 Tax=Boeremia exigua TaxID=749465 RepID=A0ACC2IBH1_9PLEO|nr:hypothetical protein OPT61_g5151 [Boeremia exigua]
MPEAKADAPGGDARMTALVPNAVTFSKRRLPQPGPLCADDTCSLWKSAGSAGMTLARLADAGTCSKRTTLRQMALGKESFLHTRSSR